MTELKTCPFCGSDKIQFNIEGHFQPWSGEGMRLWYHCNCYDCGCSYNTGDTTSMKKAAEAWNRRACVDEV